METERLIDRETDTERGRAREREPLSTSLVNEFGRRPSNILNIIQNTFSTQTNIHNTKTFSPKTYMQYDINTVPTKT